MKNKFDENSVGIVTPRTVEIKQKLDLDCGKTLEKIQDQVENPFDSEGLDDIDLERENRFKKVI